MVSLPILTFLIAHNIFQYNDNWAGGAAILMTNLIVAVYCYAAYVEDREELDSEQNNDNDEGRPRVGVFKQRVD
jgi:hypothetical protein